MTVLSTIVLIIQWHCVCLSVQNVLWLSGVS